MMKYESPEIEVLDTNITDVIATSGGDINTGNNELPWN